MIFAVSYNTLRLLVLCKFRLHLQGLHCLAALVDQSDSPESSVLVDYTVAQLATYVPSRKAALQTAVLDDGLRKFNFSASFDEIIRVRSSSLLYTGRLFAEALRL